MKAKFSELKYNQLLKDYKELIVNSVNNAKQLKRVQGLMIDLATHCNIDIKDVTPEEIIQKAKARITKIHLVN